MPNSDLGTSTSVSSPAPSSAPPAVEEIIVPDEPQKLYYPSSKRSEILSAAGLTQKAFDYDSCGKLAKSYGCSRHETPEIVKRIPQTCKQRFSKCCNGRITRQRMEKHGDIIEFISKVKPTDWDGEFWTQISSVSIRKPYPRTADGQLDVDATLQIAQTARDVLRRLAHDGKYKPGAQEQNYFIKVALQGISGRDLLIKAFYWGPHYAPSAIRAALIAQIRPDAEINVSTESNYRVESLFREMFKIIVPESETLQAELEIAFDDCDLVFYSQRIDADALGGYSSFPCTESQGNELVPDFKNSDLCHIAVIPCCLKCGKQADLISEFHSVRATPMELSTLKWEKLHKRKRRST